MACRRASVPSNEEHQRKIDTSLYEFYSDNNYEMNWKIDPFSLSNVLKGCVIVIFNVTLCR